MPPPRHAPSRPSRALLLAALLLAAVTPSLAQSPPDGGPSARHPRPIPPTPFLGYPEAYVLSDSRIHAVIVPAISRLAFLSHSADAANLLCIGPAPSDAPATGPFDIGGDWTWPVPPFFRSFLPADAPSDAEAWIDGDGVQFVRLSRHYPAPVHATLVREFILLPENWSPAFTCRQTLTRDPDAPADALPLALWHVTRIADPATLRFNVPSSDYTPTILSGTLPPGTFDVRSQVYRSFPEPYFTVTRATCTPPPSSEVKLLLPGPALAASTPDGHIAVHADAPLSHTTPEGASIDGDEIVIPLPSTRDVPPVRAELHSDTTLGYAELETVAPDASPPLPCLTDILHYSVSPPSPHSAPVAP